MFLNEVLLALFFRQKFQAALEYAFRESDKNTPSLPSAPYRRKTKGHWAYHEHRKYNFVYQ